MFPEGRRSREGELRPFKIGVGRLVADPKRTPLVVPFYHCGMSQVLRRGETVPLTVGKQMHIEVGEPMDFSNLVRTMREKGIEETEIYRRIAKDIERAVSELRLRALDKYDIDSLPIDRPK